MRFAAAVLAVGFVALAGCNRPEKTAENAATAAETPAPPIGFQHEPGFDAQGFYEPTATVSVGDLKLASIDVGAPSDFEAWEAGKRDEVFGPVQVSISDAQGDSRTVKPLAYRVAPGRIAFHGQDQTLGPIDFEGAFDTAALAQARGGGGGRPVLTGTLKIGTGAAAAVTLAYRTGD